MSVSLVSSCEKCLLWTLGGLLETSLTFHEGCVGAAVVVKVSAVRVVQAVVSQAVCVAETLQDTVHKTLRGKNKTNEYLRDNITAILDDLLMTVIW